MNSPKELANVIKKRAKSLNISISTLLSNCELSRNTLSSMQSGGYYPRIEAIYKIAEYLNCSIDYLLGRTDVLNVNKKRTDVFFTPENLYTLRKQRGLTLENVGNYVGVGKSTVRKWEQGIIKNMGQDKIAKLAACLNISPAYLIDCENSITEEEEKILELIKLLSDDEFKQVSEYIDFVLFKRGK